MLINRLLPEIIESSRKSALLLGPRQTGKSTLIQSLSPNVIINLADEQTYVDFARNPNELNLRLAATQPKTVFIDEVQRLPNLLNTIQAILDTQKRPPKFYLTGSSARKLRRGQANLLPGRIHTYFLGPLFYGEIGPKMDLKQALETGTLPGIYTEKNSSERMKTLRSYSGTYIKEEIQAEALTRNLEGFSRFLFVAAACSGQFLDLSKLASEAQIPRQSAVRYFEILEDTLIINRCPSFAKSERKRLTQHPRFFFFDTGVLNACLGSFQISEDRKGLLFEHFFFNQLLAGAYSRDKDIKISSYRTEHGAEVDFIVEMDQKIWAIELKHSRNIGASDFRGLKSFSEYHKGKHQLIIAYLGETRKKSGPVNILPWQEVFALMGL